MNEQFFDTYVSNTPTGSSHNNILSPGTPVTGTYRAWFRVVEYGTHRWRFYFTNTVDSTMNAGEVAYPDRSGGSWRIVRAEVSAAGAVGEGGRAPVPVLFGGKAEKQVAPDETFWSDEAELTVRDGEFLLWEWTLEGEGIPFTGDSMITAQRRTADGWVPDDCCPKPDLLGCDRQVRKRIAFLGDSITEGCGTSVDACDHWVGRTAFRLGADYAVWNIGLGYARASDAAYHSAWIKKALVCDAVNVCFGVNDIDSGAYGKRYAGDSAEEFMTSLERVVRILRDAGKQVILFNVPAFRFDQNPDRLAVWEEVNRRIPGLAEQYGCAFYDFAAATDCPGCHGHGRYEPHPTGYGCRFIGEDLWEKMAKEYQRTDV